METNIRFDHRRWAHRIALDWPDRPAGATVVDVAGGPAFLLLELAPRLREPRLIVADASPIMTEIARERAGQRGVLIETVTCPAETLDLPDACADLVVSKHFVRFARDLDAALREMARILRPGGRVYLIDFNREGPLLGARLLHLWILLTAPAFIRDPFWGSLRQGLPVSSLPPRLAAAGFAEPRILSRGVSYLVAAQRGQVHGSRTK
jgi:ubiquinone/menaquinone biosynthesis C-methylase UbiE